MLEGHQEMACRKLGGSGKVALTMSCDTQLAGDKHGRRAQALSSVEPKLTAAT